MTCCVLRASGLVNQAETVHLKSPIESALRPLKAKIPGGFFPCARRASLCVSGLKQRATCDTSKLHAAEGTGSRRHLWLQMRRMRCAPPLFAPTHRATAASAGHRCLAFRSQVRLHATLISLDGMHDLVVGSAATNRSSMLFVLSKTSSKSGGLSHGNIIAFLCIFDCFYDFRSCLHGHFTLTPDTYAPCRAAP